MTTTIMIKRRMGGMGGGVSEVALEFVGRIPSGGRGECCTP
jgi:hypothetical protein